MPAHDPDRVPPIFCRPKLDNVNALELALLLAWAVSIFPRFGAYLLSKAYGRSFDTDLIAASRGWGTLNMPDDPNQPAVMILANCDANRSLLLLESKFIEDDVLAQYYDILGEDAVGRDFCVEYRIGALVSHNTPAMASEWHLAIYLEEILKWFEGQLKKNPISLFFTALTTQALCDLPINRQKDGTRSGRISHETEFDLFLVMICFCCPAFASYLFKKAYKNRWM